MLFSNNELKIIADTEFLIVKSKVIEKIENLFQQTQEELSKVINSSQFPFPDNVDLRYGKIFRGENYRGFPYVVLDYPKLFTKESVFAFRTMFWWGHFFSTTLHLQGLELDRYRNHLSRNLNNHFNKDIFISVGDTPWEYNYEKSNYVILSENNIDLISSKSFIKLSQKIDLNKYGKLNNFAANFLDIMLFSLK